ncbi:hypothetical protein GUJ93_ZPchr0012g21551 [Zizania palustris]|uniref:Uncharacterized protein n=1 Tax=Zizania palustris TaxID=103762 RepID=A0A8J5WM63_ZIZPA|nr:hypothetical protein GUJ93_ZPchr0012g21551 [Zizania palustris]
MAELLLGSDLVGGGGYGLLPPESLLCRLDQIDLRLRQLEEQRQPTTARQGDDDDGVRRAAPAPRHQHTKSLPSALQHVQLKGNLMDRLNLLESRIRQLSCELDGGAAVVAGSSVPPPPLPPPPEPSKHPEPVCSAGSWSAGQLLPRGARHQLHRGKPNPSKSQKEAKCACKNDKTKKPERARRWFTVGC